MDRGWLGVSCDDTGRAAIQRSDERLAGGVAERRGTGGVCTIAVPLAQTHLMCTLVPLSLLSVPVQLVDWSSALPTVASLGEESLAWLPRALATVSAPLGV